MIVRMVLLLMAAVCFVVAHQPLDGNPLALTGLKFDGNLQKHLLQVEALNVAQLLASGEYLGFASLASLPWPLHWLRLGGGSKLPCWDASATAHCCMWCGRAQRTKQKSRPLRQCLGWRRRTLSVPTHSPCSITLFAILPRKCDRV
jgi:hypothetical protein